MRTYLYRCRTCDAECLLFEPADDAGPCEECMIEWRHMHGVWPEDPPLMKRVWQVQFAPIMQPHFNQTVGTVISDRRQMDRELRRASEEATDKTGIPHNFQQVDGREAEQVFGIDAELQDEINRAHRDGRTLARTTRAPRPTPEYQSVAERRKALERIVSEGRGVSARDARVRRSA